MSDYEIPKGKRRLSIKAVCARYGTDGERVSEATIYRAMKRKTGIPFPRPDKLNGSNSWPEERLDHYDELLAEQAQVAA